MKRIISAILGALRIVFFQVWNELVLMESTSWKGFQSTLSSSSKIAFEVLELSETWINFF